MSRRFEETDSGSLEESEEVDVSEAQEEYNRTVDVPASFEDEA